MVWVLYHVPKLDSSNANLFTTKLQNRQTERFLHSSYFINIENMETEYHIYNTIAEITHSLVMVNNLVKRQTGKLLIYQKYLKKKTW